MRKRFCYIEYEMIYESVGCWCIGMRIECLRWHAKFVGKRVLWETLDDGVVSVYLDIGDV